MPDAETLTRRLWDTIRSERTVMLGLDGESGVPPRPMTALIEGDEDEGPLWIFTSTETELARALGMGPAPATISVTAKGHDLFANITGSLARTDDRATIDRLWGPFIAAWYEGGKDDPTLALLRFDAAGAEIWESGSGIVAGIKALLGIDPKKDYRDHKAEVPL